MTESEYRAHPALNFSRLKLMAVSPLAFQKAKPFSGAFQMGRAIHAAVLEPDAFPSRFVKLPSQFSRRYGKDYEAWAKADGREVLLADEYDAANACAEAAILSPSVSRHLTGADTEVSVFTKIRGVEVKGHLDWTGDISIGDLKSVASMNMDAFFRQCVNLDYLSQFAFYSDVFREAFGGTKPFKAIVVEKAAPHDIAVVSIPNEALDYGRQRYDAWLDRYIDCMSRDKWPGVSGDDDGEIAFVMPRWAGGVDDDAEGGLEGVGGGDTDCQKDDRV
jgi:hypothetical protein